MEPSKSGFPQRAYKHAALVVLSLLPFGVSATAAFAAWKLSEGFDPVSRLIFAFFSWIIAFAAGTRAFWRIVEALAPR